MALLATQTILQTGLEATYQAAAAGGDTCHPTTRGFLHVKNGGGAPITITIAKRVDQFNQPGFGDIPLSDLVVVCTNAEERMIAIPPESHGAGGVASIAYSAVTTVTVAYIENQRL